MKNMFPILIFLIVGTLMASEEPVSLFNGKNLAGWKVECRPQDADKKVWRVEDGALACNTEGRKDFAYIWLVSEAAFSDFDFTCEIQTFADSPGNSGIQIRSRYTRDSTREGERKNGWLDGPQVDVHPPGPWRTGFIYDETMETRRWIHPSRKDWKLEEAVAPSGWRWVHADGSVVQDPKAPAWSPSAPWNHLRIRAEGTHIQTWVNGIAVSDFDGSEVLMDEAHQKAQVGLSGHIALQLHGGSPLHIRYRNLLINPL